jgi:hypothetical protein
MTHRGFNSLCLANSVVPMPRTQRNRSVVLARRELARVGEFTWQARERMALKFVAT